MQWTLWALLKMALVTLACGFIAGEITMHRCFRNALSIVPLFMAKARTMPRVVKLFLVTSVFACNE